MKSGFKSTCCAMRVGDVDGGEEGTDKSFFGISASSGGWRPPIVLSCYSALRRRRRRKMKSALVCKSFSGPALQSRRLRSGLRAADDRSCRNLYPPMNTEKSIVKIHFLTSSSSKDLVIIYEQKAYENPTSIQTIPPQASAAVV